MRRRDFMGMLGGAAAWPIAGAAQTPGRVYRFGIFTPSSKSAGVREPGQLVILEEMRLAGFIEGQNLQVLDEGFGVPESELAAGAAALVKAAPDAIQAGHPKYAKAARAATQTIPIVTTTEDMVADGFSTWVAHPDGNVTGISLLSLKLDGKRGDLLAEAVPGLRQMAVLADPGTHKPEHIRDLTELAKARGLELSAFFAKTRDEIVPALDAAKAAGAGAINVLAGQLFYFNHELVIERVQELRLPAIYQWPEWAKQGGLIGYGSRFEDLYPIMARQLVESLRGTALVDIPIEQPTKFELAINLKTAKALGVEIPPTLLASADQIVE